MGSFGFYGYYRQNKLHRMLSAISSTDQEAWDFLRDDCRDTDFLKKNGISMVYSPDAVSNYNLIEIRKDVYFLKSCRS